MKSCWFKGLDKDETKAVKAAHVDSLPMRKRLKVMLESKISSKNKLNCSSSRYDNPNWAFLQADNVGYERALREILELI